MILWGLALFRRANCESQVNAFWNPSCTLASPDSVFGRRVRVVKRSAQSLVLCRGRLTPLAARSSLYSLEYRGRSSRLWVRRCRTGPTAGSARRSSPLAFRRPGRRRAWRNRLGSLYTRGLGRVEEGTEGYHGGLLADAAFLTQTAAPHARDADVGDGREGGIEAPVRRFSKLAISAESWLVRLWRIATCTVA